MTTKPVRDNPDLDDVFDPHNTRPPEPTRRARRKSRYKEGSPTKDQVRRMAFVILARLKQLEAPDRARVLRQALKVNTA